MTELKHGQMAYIRYAAGEAKILALYQNYDEGFELDEDEEPLAYWCFFGSDITARPDEVVVLQFVTVVSSVA